MANITDRVHISQEEYQGYVREWGKEASPASYNKAGRALYGAVSPDGLSWRILDKPLMLHFSDTKNIIHFDPSLNKYVGYFRTFDYGRRCIARAETEDFSDWPLPETIISPGPAETPYTDYYTNGCCFYPGRTDLRLIFTNAYHRDIDAGEIRLAISRDSRQWHWVPGHPLLERGGPGEWDHGHISNVGGFIRTKDGRMLLLYLGYNVPHKFPRSGFMRSDMGTAWWKADRLTALEAPERGEFTSASLRLNGKRLLLNLFTERAGEVLVEVLDEKLKPIPGFSFAEANPIWGDHAAVPVSWNGASDLSQFTGQFISLRFRMRAAKLYAMKAEG